MHHPLCPHPSVRSRTLTFHQLFPRLWISGVGVALSALACHQALAQGPLTNGWMHIGTISSAGDSDSWTFEAAAGDAIVVRAAELSTTAFSPRIQLFSPAAALLGSSSSTVGAEVAITATNTGTFTVVVADNAGTQTNAYRLTLAKTGAAVAVAPGDEGGRLTNGVMHLGSIDVGDLDLWTIEADAGESIVVRMAETNSAVFSPQLRIYGPTGTLLNTSSSTIGAEVVATAAGSGTFLVVAGDFTGSWQGSGNYRLTLAKTGDPVVVSAGDEGGPLTNGVMHMGTIDVGDLDVWTVEAIAGESIVVRMGETTNFVFSPQVRIYGPTGTLLDTSFSAIGAEAVATAAGSGTFLVVVGDFTGSWQGSGDYRLTLAKTGDPAVVSAGDEGGPLTNGVMNIGTIHVGDLDVWTVEANAGDNIVVRMGETSSVLFSPQVRIYGPNGALVGSGSSTVGAEAVATAASSGTFLVVAGDFSGSWQGSGEYRLTLAKTGDPVVVSAGDEGGPLTNGVMHIGIIDVGDLDLWTIEATAGDRIVVRMGETSPVIFAPQLRIYAPGGALLVTESSTAGAEVTTTASATGTFLVVAGDITGSWQGSGEYRLTLAKTGDPAVVAAGDEGGAMTGAGVYAGAIDVGDMDVFTFTVCAGESIFLRMEEVEASTLTPQLRLYGRDGTLLNTASGTAAAQISRTAPANGNYLVVAADITGSWSGAGDYTLTVNGLSDGLKLCTPIISGANAELGGAGGAAGGTFVLLTHTNVAVPATLWNPIRTNQFDPFGTFTWTNAFNILEPQRYFRLSTP